MSTLAVVGPTASGKSAVATAIAERRTADGSPTEIVAIDAFTVYRTMDVGTAKPPPEQRGVVPHHLVDVIDPWEELTVARFQQLARRAIADIHDRGATPLLVGGSGLYWRAVVDDLQFPPTDAGVRAKIADRWEQDPDAAHAHLAQHDPDAASRIDPPNVRRTIRALEVLELTGQRFSTFDDAWSHHVSIYGDLEVAYLEPSGDELRAAIHERAVAMVAEGLLQEAARLLALGRGLSRTARQAIGYAEAFAVLKGSMSGDDLVDAIATRTWRFARRQRSWFRTDPRCVPVTPDDVVARWTASDEW